MLDPYIIYSVGKNKSILDVACGKGKWGFLIGTSYQSPRIIIGVDIWLPYLKHAKYHRIYDDVVLCDAKYLPFRSFSFDVTLACEVLEHIPKNLGIVLLKEAERVSREKVIISTPHQWLDQRDDISFQEHKSRWKPDDLRKKGYRVHGVGFSFLGRFSPLKLRVALSPLAYYFPNFAFLLLASKSLRRRKN